MQVIVSVKMDSKAFGIWYTYQLEYATEELLEVLSVQINVYENSDIWILIW